MMKKGNPQRGGFRGSLVEWPDQLSTVLKMGGAKKGIENESRPNRHERLLVGRTSKKKHCALMRKVEEAENFLTVGKRGGDIGSGNLWQSTTRKPRRRRVFELTLNRGDG